MDEKLLVLHVKIVGMTEPESYHYKNETKANLFSLLQIITFALLKVNLWYKNTTS